MSSSPFLALITPLGGGLHPEHPIVIPPPGGPPGPVDPGYSPPWARPPVDPGYSPPWARPPVDPGYSPPWARPPVHVMPPIYYPPVIWPNPGHPEHPIVIPPVEGLPPGVPMPPIYIPPKPPGEPTHPIVIPPPGPGGLPEFPIAGEGWNLRYVLGYGWIVVPPADWVPPVPPPHVQPLKT